MAQLDDLQAYVNFELPRRTVLLTVAITGYDGDPTLPAAPDIIDNAPLGTFYLQETPDTLWRKDGSLTWVLVDTGGGGGGTSRLTATLEDFTITLDSVGGSDPSSEVTLTTQAEATAQGAFQTVPAVMDALPNNINHIVTLQFPNGTFALGALEFGRMDRFNFGWATQSGFTKTSGALRFTSTNGLVQAPATSTYAVISSDGVGNVVLAADPGFSADQHRSAFLRVSSGTGAGQIKPVRTHLTVNWQVAGSFNPVLDGTSVVEVVVPAARIETSTSSADIKTKNTQVGYINIIFDAIDLSTLQAFASIQPIGCTMSLQGGARLLDLLLWMSMCNVVHDTCVIDTGTIAFTAVSIQSGLFRTKTGHSEPMLLRGASATNAFALFSAGDDGGLGQGSMLYLFGAHALDGFAGVLVEAHRKTALARLNTSSGSPTPRSDGTAATAIRAVNGAQVTSDDTTQLGLTLTATVDIDIDSVTKTYAELNADPNKSLVGPLLSLVAEEIF